MTIFVNHDTGRVVWVTPCHGKETLTKFFGLLSEDQRAAIRLVSVDGAKWVATCIEKFCPNDVQCIDPFHVVEWVNKTPSKVLIAHGMMQKM